MDQDESDADNRSVQDQLPDALEGLKRQPAEDLLYCLLWDLGRIGYEAALRGDEQTVKRMGLLAKVATEIGAKAEVALSRGTRRGAQPPKRSSA